MSQPNEPPLEIVEYNIKVKWSDGNEETIIGEVDEEPSIAED